MVYAKRVHGLRNETGARPGYEPAVGCIRWGYRCPVLINEYRRGDSGTMDALYLDGTVPVFFLYLLDGFAKEQAQLLVQKIQRKQMFKILKKMLDLEPTTRIILNFRRGR